MLNLLKKKYEGVQLDLIVTLGAPPLSFLFEHQVDLWVRGVVFGEKLQQLYNKSRELDFSVCSKSLNLLRKVGSGGRDRTADLGVMNPTL